MSQEVQSSPDIKTFVLLDLETTGLLHRQGKSCRIIEMCLVAVMREHLLSLQFPRVLNKLSLIFNPHKFIDPHATNIHGISNDLVQDLPIFSTDDCELISKFIHKLPSPVCLVAHNGVHFDFPLLKSEMQRLGKPLPEDLLCVDSLPGFRSTLPCFLESRKFLSELQQLEQYETLLNDGNDQLLRLEAERLETLFNADLDVTTIKSITQTEKELRSNTFRSSPKPSGSLYWRQQVNNTTPSKKRGGRYYSFKLGDIYHALLNKTPVSHRAENDVMNMLECIHVIGTPFVEWMDDNCIAFKNIRLYC